GAERQTVRRRGDDGGECLRARIEDAETKNSPPRRNGGQEDRRTPKETSFLHVAGQCRPGDVYSLGRGDTSSIVRAATLILLLALGQSNHQQFAGAWTCEYFGKILARLELQGSGGALIGRMSIGVFHVDSNGKLD